MAISGVKITINVEGLKELEEFIELVSQLKEKSIEISVKASLPNKD